MCTVDAGWHDASVKPVSYSAAKPSATASNGSSAKLKWRPYRPAKSEVHQERESGEAEQPGAQFAQYVSPAAAEPTVGGTVDPFDDPFEDGDSAAAPLSSTPGPVGEPGPQPSGQLRDQLRDNLLEPESPEAEIAEELPKVLAEEAEQKSEGLASQQPPGLLPQEEAPLVVAPTVPEQECASVKLVPINRLTHDITASGDMFPAECPLVDEGTRPRPDARGWAPVTFTWKASALCSKPAYFEQTQLERYGHSCGPYLQPVISGAHFFLTVPALPYKMGLYPPNECVYTLGYYRPGSCAPYLLDPLPLSIRAGLMEAGVWTGMVFLIP